MSFDVLALLFIAFSVISSLVNKWQARRKVAEREQRPYESVDAPKPDISEIEPSEWDIFRELEPEPREFQEVRGARPVSEADTGPEFQEVRGARPVSEADTGPEFQDPLAEEEAPYRTVDVKRIVSDEIDSTLPAPKKVRVGKRRLSFDKNALINGILYQEILGPPRSEASLYR